jgi:uncharacterized protein YjbI with pentapeptide repeats
MTLWRRRLQGFAMALVVVGAAWRGSAAEPPLITPDAAYREVARSGYLRQVEVAGDLDLSRLQAPAGVARIVLQDVRVKGRVHSSANGPAVPLSIEGSVLQSLDLSGARLRAGFTLDFSTIQGAARFDDAQFDGPFVLNAGTLAGGAVFRRARFGAAVEIVATQFDKPAGASGGVSFADSRFAAPARFDRSRFAGAARFDTSRFEADASFLGLVVPGRASWRNVIFSRDAEFRFCRLGDADFGDAEQMTVFSALADFRGCTMRSARFDYVDGRGDVMLVNVHVTPGDLTLRHAALRGGRTDFSGLRVAGRLDLEGAYISALQFHWSELAGALRRAGAHSDVLRPLFQRLDALQQKEEARNVWALLAERVFRERLAAPNINVTEKASLWLEWVFWGWPTGYGTQLGRIASLTLAAWLLLSLPLLLWPRVRLGQWKGPLSDAPPRHRAAPPDALKISRVAAVDRRLQLLSYSFGLMFAAPGLRLRPAEPLPGGLQIHLAVMRGVGALFLALLALTLANVSPVFQAILGKVVG